MKEAFYKFHENIKKKVRMSGVLFIGMFFDFSLHTFDNK